MWWKVKDCWNEIISRFDQISECHTRNDPRFILHVQLSPIFQITLSNSTAVHEEVRGSDTISKESTKQCWILQKTSQNKLLYNMVPKCGSLGFRTLAKNMMQHHHFHIVNRHYRNPISVIVPYHLRWVQYLLSRLKYTKYIGNWLQ